MTTSIPLGDYDPGLHDVKVINRTPRSGQDFGCESRPGDDEVTFRVLRRPIVDAVEPSPICTKQQGYPVAIEGENFVFDTRDGLKPTVTVGGNEVSVNAPSSPEDSDDCTETDINGVYSCTKLEVQVPKGSLHEDGTVTTDDVVVDNPPGMTECKNKDPGKIRNAPPPQVASAEIQEACNNAPDKMVVEGKFHFSMGNDKPQIDLTDPSMNTVTYTNVSLNGMCSGPLENTSETTKHCTVTTFDLKSMTDASGGEYIFDFENPASVQCSVEETVQVQRIAPMQPEITGVDESEICALGDTITINGNNFQMGATVAIDGNEADSVNVTNNGTKIEATWMGDIGAGMNPTLTVTNPDTCSDSFAIGNAVDFIEGPIAVFLDPQIHYNDIEFRGTLYLTQAADTDVSKVQVRPNSMTSAVRDLSFKNPTTMNGRVLPLLPDEDPNNMGNPLPAGTYDVRLTEDVSGTECGAWIDDLWEVTDETKLAVQEISPQYGEPNSSTSVRITADPMASSMNKFQPVPRVYLSPASGTTGTTAVEMSGVAFNSSTEITGIVPSGLNPGDYNVVVVNPNGRVGLLTGNDGFTVTQSSKPPPTISNVSPGTWDVGQAALTVEVSGSNFRATSSSGVSVNCETGSSPNSISVSNATASKLTLSVDTNGMTAGDACTLTVTNPNGSKDTYSPIATVEPSFNFIDFENAPNLNTARRWPAMSSGIPSSQQRFVYVLGGDGGGTGSVRNTGEFAQIDRFGNVQSWTMLPYQIPNGGRTLARAVRIRDFIYLVGGADGSATTTDIHRANVLDPQHTPEIDGLDFNFVGTSKNGVAPGDYFYRVSVVHKNSSSYNPGGETLASDPQPVSVPNLGNRFNVQVIVSWSSSLSDVKEFRLYRTTQPNQAVGKEQLLATLTPGTTQYTDDGTGSFTQESPLPLGALGKWHQASNSLGQARQMHAVRGLIDPNNANKAYLYAMGGEDGSGNMLNSIERITIDDPSPSTPRSQSISGVTTVSQTLSSSRTELEGLLATPANANKVNSPRLYAAGGKTSRMGPGAKGSTTIESWEIQANGGLGSMRTETGINRSRAGFVGTVANNYAVVFGGHNASADNTGDNSNEMGGSGSITKWDSLSAGINMDNRYQFGRTSLVGFFYIGGGTDGSPLNTVEYSVVGTTAR